MAAPSLSTDPMCQSCAKVPHGFFTRYRSFLLSPGTLIAAGNALLLALGFAAALLGQPQAARWLYLASALVGGAPIWKLAAGNIVRRFDLTAGVMVSIAMIAALIVGEYSAAALVALMMLVGEMLENFTIARADRALEALEDLVPMVVTLRQEGQDVPVPLAAVRKGDRVLVRPGEAIPVDGIVEQGSAAVDQSSITGESMPVDKGPGAYVYAGTRCTTGSLDLHVEHVGQETTLGQMIALVKEARSTQAPVQRIANHYAQYLTPLAMAIAIATFFLTRDITRAITVLIVICPCSLVLATPTAVVAAIGNAARHGVLVKHGPAMEQIGRVDVVAFDKTGTLTLGEPRVAKIVASDSLAPAEILGLVASAERSSEHPLGRAIVGAAQDAGIALSVPQRFEALPGHGVSAVIQGRAVAVGQRMLAGQGISLDPVRQAQIARFREQGFTVVPVAVDHELAGLILLTDAVRVESRQAVARLKALGIHETILISGDNEAAAQAVGRELGVDRVYAEMLPEQKLDLLRRLQSEGRRVAYVGDGVNDAPALAAADVGIAMGGIGTHVAMETADIVLLTDQIGRVPEVISLSRATLRTVRTNVIFSMTMNLLSVGLGIWGLIGPVVGAVMHELSALPVIANSVRLLARRPESAMPIYGKES